MDEKLLVQMIEQKYVSKRKHPTEDLFIYNYTAAAQYDWVWNDVTRKCRGLILDSEGSVVARPFEKFFNLDVDTELPKLPFDVSAKLDGSLGILYWVGNEPFIATRGSFESDQARYAKTIIDRKGYTFADCDKGCTYLFEIIYPGNRIVVDYGTMEDLVLLAVIDNETGLDVPLHDIGTPIVERYTDIEDVRQLAERQTDNAEGFVVRFENGFRVKVKFEEYKRLHRIVTQVSNVVIWEYLRDNKPFTELLERVPDEFYDWLTATKDEIHGAYSDIVSDCHDYFYAKPDTMDRKELAAYFTKHKHPHVLFSMLDGKDYSQGVWKTVRPKWSQPFKTDEI